ncbi:hypothetical protein FRC18_008267 [Serendipita sp. 400]|nr:hypothetical protein FRC18_008267 [Serendipita sp. 400]
MQTAPVCRLPDDILMEIFRHGAETNDGNHHLQFQQVVSRVCTRFRSVALEDALLWIKIRYVPKNVFVRRCIELSKSALLDIAFHGNSGRLSDKPEYEEFFSLVNRECFRWKSVYIIIPLNLLPICTPLWDRNADTPYLVRISLYSITPVGSDFDNSHLELLPGAYPALREVKLATSLPSWNWSRRSITRLELGPFGARGAQHEPRHGPSYENLFQMLKYLESTIEHFALRGYLRDSPHDERAVGTLSFKALKTLVFSLESISAQELLAVCSFERVENVDLLLGQSSREQFHSIFHRPDSAPFSTAQHLDIGYIRSLDNEKCRILEAAFPNITDLQISLFIPLDDGLTRFLSDSWPSISSLGLWQIELPRLWELLEARRQKGLSRLRKIEIRNVKGIPLKSDFDRISLEVEELTIRRTPQWAS